MKDNILLKEAFRLMAAGFSVIPLKKDKRPLINEVVPFRTNPAQEQQILDWWTEHPNANIGIITGRISGITVIDLDIYKPNSVDPSIFPETYTIRTGQGGLQLYYQYAEGFTISANGYTQYPNLDMRSDGGYVVAAPSVTDFIDKNGKRVGGPYTIEKNLPFAPFPLHLFPKTKESRPLSTQIGVPSGSRNDSIASFAGRLLRTAKESDWYTEVYQAVALANKTYNPPLPDDELKATFDSIAKKEKDSRGGILKTEFVPSLSLKDLMGTKFPDVRYSIEPFFEHGTLNMVSAPPNNWKSWLIFLFAEAMASGGKFVGNFNTEKTRVMIVNEEDSTRLVQDRFNLLGITDPTLPIFFRISQGAKIEEEFIDRLIAEAKEKEIGAIMFDSLRAMHIAEENSSSEMQKVLDSLKKITREGITVIFTHHHKKKPMMGKPDATESFRGSTGILAAVSGYISLEEEVRDGEKVIIVKHLKSKVSEKIEPFEIKIDVTRNDMDKVTAMKFVYSGKYEEKNKKLDDAMNSILDCLDKDKGWKSKKEFIDLGIASKNIVGNAITALKASGKIRVMTRKSAQSQNIIVNSVGKGSENLYSLNEEGDVVQEDLLDNF